MAKINGKYIDYDTATLEVSGNTIAVKSGVFADVLGADENYVTDSDITNLSNLSGTNTGDNSANTNYADDYRAANFVADTDYLTPTTAGTTYVPYSNATSNVELGEDYYLAAQGLFAYDSDAITSIKSKTNLATGYAGVTATSNDGETKGVAFLSYGSSYVGTTMGVDKSTANRIYTYGGHLVYDTVGAYNIYMGTNDTLALTLDTSQVATFVNHPIGPSSEPTTDYQLANKKYVDDNSGGSGTVTSVGAGDGMDFTSITSTGNVTMGTPGTTTATSINEVTATSHTHLLDESGIEITASQVSDFDTEVSNNTDVAANTTARHVAVTVSDTAEIDMALSGQEISASIVSASIDESKLDTSVNASLDLADSAIQDVVDDTTPQLGGHLDWNSNGMKLVSQTVGGSDGNVVYLSSANTWTQADASADTTCSSMLALRLSATEVLTHGLYTTTGLTAGSIYYVSETAGAITTTKPSTSTSIVRVVGYALSTTELFVDPDKTWVENA